MFNEFNRIVTLQTEEGINPRLRRAGVQISSIRLISVPKNIFLSQNAPLTTYYQPPTNLSPYFIKGLIIGFSVAAPVGPIGVLTIKRTLTEGRLSGFVTGLGAAGADTVYGFVAGFGLTAVSSFLLAYEFWLKLIGGIFLLYLGVKSFISKPQKEGSYNSTKGLFSNFSSTFLLTITNPTTILSFLAIFAGLGLASEKTDYISSSWLVAGVFLGSAAWWLLLSSVVGFFNKKVSPQTMVWINRFSGVIIITFGFLALYSCVVK